MNETEIIKTLNDYIKSPYKCDTCKYCSGQRNTQKAIEEILDLYQKEKEKNRELERKWEEQKYLIKLSENELLGYMQGYEDGFNHNSTAVQQVIKSRESEIHQLEIERLKKIISKLKIEIEEEKERNKDIANDLEKYKKECYLQGREEENKAMLGVIQRHYISKDNIREKIKELELERKDLKVGSFMIDAQIGVLKRLWEENNGK